MELSQLALEDVEALCLGPSFLMADPMGPLLDQDEDEALSPSSSLEVKAPASPSLSFSSCASSPLSCQALSFSSPSPPPSPPPTHSSSFLGTKAEVDLLSLSLLNAGDLLDGHVGADDDKDDAFEGMEWMSEKIDLSEFDLDSLIGSCSSEAPSSPEDLLASLDSPMDLDLWDTTFPVQHNDPDLGPALPEPPSSPQEPSPAATAGTEDAPVKELDVKSEPASPSQSPSSPVYTLELGSEVDVLDAEKMATSPTSRIIQSSSPIVLSIPTSGHFVVVLANKEEASLISLPEQSITASPSSDSDSDSGIDSGVESFTSSPARHLTPSQPTPGSSRTKPYCKPEPIAASSPKASKVKSASGAPRVVEKKLKKMEQNKTAATRYRQKKRVEQESLTTEREELERKNHELKEKVESISREIKYLKDLMEEVRKHRRGKSSSVA